MSVTSAVSDLQAIRFPLSFNLGLQWQIVSATNALRKEYYRAKLRKKARRLNGASHSFRDIRAILRGDNQNCHRDKLSGCLVVSSSLSAVMLGGDRMRGVSRFLANVIVETLRAREFPINLGRETCLRPYTRAP